ncbi:MAG TPA: ATP-binding protein, partial [Polyangiaceae bacterium]
LEFDAVGIGILLLALAPHVDRHYERVYAWLPGESTLSAPRVSLALELFSPAVDAGFALREYFCHTSTLMRSRFVRLIETGRAWETSELSKVISVSPRVLRFLTDQPGAEIEVESARAREPLPRPTARLVEALGKFATLWPRGSRTGPIGVLQSEDDGAALSAVAALAEPLGVTPILIDLSRPSAARFPVERIIESALDEARLLSGLPAIAGFDRLDERNQASAIQSVLAELERFEGPCVLVTRIAPDLRHELRHRPVLVCDVPLPEAPERHSLWLNELASRAQTQGHLPEIAARYCLGSTQIRDAARMVKTLDDTQGIHAEHLKTASRAQSRHGLGQLAQRVPSWGSWDDLVLPSDSVQKLRSIVDQVRHRDQVFLNWGLGAKVSSWRGVTTMFAGPPGTGKTLSASLIADALGLELFRIDLARVVSKYIGETEKNLDQVFRAAYRSNTVLFFDEADALFGKRTEVKDAHDRYANVETSYLLQQLEQFEGLVVLATNLKKNVDPAFMRRIDVLVDFPFPNVEHRLRLWQALMPSKMPRASDLDLGFLSEHFELAGGHIKNIVQAAALQAASENAPVGMRHLLLGVRWELHKQGKIASRADFGPYASLVPELSDNGTANISTIEVRRSREVRRR